MRNLRRWGAVYVLILLFLGSWLGQFVTRLSEFRGEQQGHGEAFTWADYLERIERKIDTIHEKVGAGPAGQEEGDDAAIDPEPHG